MRATRAILPKLLRPVPVQVDRCREIWHL